MSEIDPIPKLITDFPKIAYECGIRAGERVRLRRELIAHHESGEPTGENHQSSEIWKVLRGTSEKPSVVWLSQPDGERHVWSDDNVFWEWFERVSVRLPRHWSQRSGRIELSAVFGLVSGSPAAQFGSLIWLSVWQVDNRISALLEWVT